ncbi:hypothetical protein ISN45_At02g031010 [Arabidopsis thaliana x Arabidopsis arenosa]|uniref:Uncharacterized protein n=1 Tax=Arabidopsis thaliana x Arabidopsis arenosa TaxID=1240361 RepID=A0A8T2G5W2_9BRAS|nr:hypothetical protein ISN45_At02g031010 [Arabidopsis thaliana x Arabidopsis arenosa]
MIVVSGERSMSPSNTLSLAFGVLYKRHYLHFVLFVPLPSLHITISLHYNISLLHFDSNKFLLPKRTKFCRDGEAKLEAVLAKLLYNKGEREVEEESSDSEPRESTTSLRTQTKALENQEL